MSERINPDKTDNVIGALGAANQRLMRENAQLREALRELREATEDYLRSGAGLDRLRRALGDTPLRDDDPDEIIYHRRHPR
jgi:uncharacterized membrane protein YccC